MITIFEGLVPNSLGDMESRMMMSKNLVSCSRRLGKSASSNVERKKRKVTFKHLYFKANDASLLRKIISRTFHSYNIGPYIKLAKTCLIPHFNYVATSSNFSSMQQE